MVVARGTRHARSPLAPEGAGRPQRRGRARRWPTVAAAAVAVLATLGAAPASARPAPAQPLAAVVSPDQSVRFELAEGGSAAGRLQFQLQVFSGGEGRGRARLAYSVAEDGGGAETVSVEIVLVAAELLQSEAPVVSFAGEGVVCRSGGGCTPASFTGSVRPDTSAPDCLIYDVVGPNVHLRVEARGQLVVRP